MTARLYQFAANKKAALEVSGENLGQLPELSLEMVEQFFNRLSAEDKTMVLRHKVLPVAILPHITLYGAAGDYAAGNAAQSGQRVIASINPQDLRLTIRRKLGPELLRKATHHLRLRRPEYSAFTRITGLQIFWGFIFLAWIFAGWRFLTPFLFYAVLSFMCGIFFLAVVALRLLCLLQENVKRPSVFPKLDDDDLPDYSVLVPVFRETQVLEQLVQSLSRLNYPKAKLDIKLILEETDTPMQRAVAALDLPDYFDVIVVPSGKPQTKPRALNYALQFARGQLLTIYDAEDEPEPMQLRIAAEHFAAAAPELACLQAELAFYNPNENWLTRGIMAQTPEVIQRLAA